MSCGCYGFGGTCTSRTLWTTAPTIAGTAMMQSTASMRANPPALLCRLLDDCVVDEERRIVESPRPSLQCIDCGLRLDDDILGARYPRAEPTCRALVMRDDWHWRQQEIAKENDRVWTRSDVPSAQTVAQRRQDLCAVGITAARQAKIVTAASLGCNWSRPQGQRQRAHSEPSIPKIHVSTTTNPLVSVPLCDDDKDNKDKEEQQPQGAKADHFWLVW